MCSPPLQPYESARTYRNYHETIESMARSEGPTTAAEIMKEHLDTTKFLGKKAKDRLRSVDWHHKNVVTMGANQSHGAIAARCLAELREKDSREEDALERAEAARKKAEIAMRSLKISSPAPLKKLHHAHASGAS
jgi:multidrug resistance efflux pump